MIKHTLVERILLSVSVIMCILSVPCFILGALEYGFWFYLISGSILFLTSCIIVIIISIIFRIRIQKLIKGKTKIDDDYFNENESIEELKEKNKKEKRIMRIIDIITALLIILFIIISFFLLNDIDSKKKNNNNQEAFRITNTTYYEYKTSSLIEDVMLEPGEYNTFVIYKSNLVGRDFYVTKKSYGYFNYDDNNEKIDLHITLVETWNGFANEWEKTYPSDTYLYFYVHDNYLYLNNDSIYKYKKRSSPSYDLTLIG